MWNLSLTYLELAIFINCVAGAAIAGQWEGYRNATRFRTLQKIGGRLLLIWFGLAVVIGTIIFAFISLTVDNAIIYFQFQAWINFWRGRWDNLEGKKREDFIAGLPIARRNFVSPFARAWFRAVAKRNNIKL